eukprot:gnl/MRDRNA2_/MRDRNA2_69700_c0_seq1.p2 gnl/MRDRNA2_/MRDRNA2_69700_c0~~gnl/MRDRNA2_/MRDRNA2_69700_c0_seq1.p2  ORF type:complete len:124 (-),score=19.43 gnl/MRDRNA2_/MRDRNA2_69700_c0_seq1:393-719(-)
MAVLHTDVVVQAYKTCPKTAATAQLAIKAAVKTADSNAEASKQLMDQRCNAEINLTVSIINSSWSHSVVSHLKNNSNSSVGVQLPSHSMLASHLNIDNNSSGEGLLQW